MPKLQEISVTFNYERIRWDDVAILECKQIQRGENVNGHGPAIIAKGPCEPDELVQGLTYYLYGRWVEHERYGRQFHFRTLVRTQPHGQAGVIRYLRQAPHIGQQTARALWDRYGGDAVRILRESPEVASAGVPRLSEEKAREAAAFLQQWKATEDATIDLIDLLGGRGLPRNLAKRAIAKFGNRAAKLIERNPYLLMKFKGCGFLRADTIYLDTGGNPAALKRQALCAWHSLDSNGDGHTWHPVATVTEGLQRQIASADVRAPRAVRLAKRARLIATHRDEAGKLWLAEYRRAAKEERLAEDVRRLLAEHSHWPTVAGLDVSPHQAEQLATALQSPLAIFGGGPGTGKTYSAARLIRRILDRHGPEAVAVCAPTGKAAVRISEVMAGYGVDIRATTIHRLLRVEEKQEGEGWRFVHGPGNPLPERWVIVDEASMIDTDLMADLLAACGRGTHVLLVGDIGQLPPVGHGAPLRDMIAAGVPAGCLAKIRRNCGMIVRACAEIRAGRAFATCIRLSPASGDNLKLIPAGNNKRAAEAILNTIEKIAAAKLFDPVWEVQVIVAVNRKSGLSRHEMNGRLQTMLNPGGKRANGNPFRVGDKIVCLKNGLHPVWEDAEPDEGEAEVSEDNKVFVANGEQARVIEVAERITIAELKSPKRQIKIPRGSEGDEGSTGCNWDLAYAISCHKSQGSQWPCVIVALDEYPGANLVCSREWLYTAISRAERVCLLVGRKSVAQNMIRRQAIGKRKTFLCERIGANV